MLPASKSNQVLSKRRTLGLFSKKDAGASWEPTRYWITPDEKEEDKRKSRR